MAFLDDNTKRLLNNLPWYWAAAHWIISGLLAILALVPTLLAVINPFWFRQWLLDKVVDSLDVLPKIRDAILGGVYEKYSLFETIKNAGDDQ